MKTGRLGAALWVLACVSGCSGSDDDASGSMGMGTMVGDLRTECEAYCRAQLVPMCPGTFPLGSCNDSCVGLGAMFPECDLEWRTLNHCMANADLFCDDQGNPAVGPECFDDVDAYGNCLGVQ